jgi:hypothetical protein
LLRLSFVPFSRAGTVKLAVPLKSDRAEPPSQPAEFDDESYVESAEFKAAAEGKKEVRRWKLYKATPNTASA